MKSERWLPVVGFESFYHVSNLGRVKRVALGQGSRGCGYILKPWLAGTEKRYLVVELHMPSVAVTAPIHRLVAYAFIGPRPGGKEINHKDANSRNNRAENLEYVSTLGNYWHARKHGKARFKISDSDGAKILALKGRFTQAVIAKKFGVSTSLVWQIHTGKVRAVKAPEDYHDV